MKAPYEFVNAYALCGIWLDIEYEVSEDMDALSLFSVYAQEKMQRDCDVFWTAARDRIEKRSAKAIATAGNDFWLSRNGHGSGFWDREELYGEEDAAWLQDLAETFGRAYVERNHDENVFTYES